jgi:formate-dependent phosphoribosylglycinamide formyltransferase (GAR transformylase)
MLSLSIIIGCYLISAKPITKAVEPQSQNKVKNSVMIDINDASKLLGLPTDEIKRIIATEKKVLETTGSFEGERFPYITIEERLYFEKTRLLIWAQESAAHHREYGVGYVQ